MRLFESGHFIQVLLYIIYYFFQNVENAVQNTLGFLERMNLNTLKTDPYALAIVSYALAISDSALKRTFNDALKEVKDSPEGNIV